MAGMRLGGIDPSILRELSGVYKPFVKAFKELISNAFDADADRVDVTFSDDFTTITVEDDGVGMTIFDFRNDFTRIGGGSRRWAGERTRRGRPRIGSKGIGFLALARYCDHLRVRSSANRTFVAKFGIEQTPGSIEVRTPLGIPLENKLINDRMKCVVLRAGSKKGKLEEGSHFSWNRGRTRLKVSEDVGPVEVRLSFDCSGLGFEAVLDFHRLLQLADTADLETLDDFATVELFETDGKKSIGTQIVVDRLKGFARTELRADRRRGFVRNIASRSGLEHFLWYLSRSTPIPYSSLQNGINSPVVELLDSSEQMTLQHLVVNHGGKSESLQRPILPFESDAIPIPSDLLIAFDVDEAGVRAKGFLAGSQSVIFPAEYRGIAIRVRGVAIGNPGFLGAEYLLTGAQKAALSQITGEINILDGLDAVDTLNPGRESFYEESEQFKILRRQLIGEGEHVGGALGRTIAAVLRRSETKSSLADALGRAMFRRRALEDVSAAITQLIATGDRSAAAIRRMLKSQRSEINGLPSTGDFELEPPLRMGGMPVVQAGDLSIPYEVDYDKGEVRLNAERAGWNWSLLLFDRRFTIVNKKGGPNLPVAEVDHKHSQIYVNWGHPIKLQMDERGFLRTALALVLSKEASADDTSNMMDLLVKLMSFSTHHDG
jgi:hypothetical protein